MKKTAVFPMILLISLLICACSTVEPAETETGAVLPEERTEILYQEQPIEIKIVEGYIGSSLVKQTELTPFKTAEQVDLFVSHPLLHTTAGKSYVLRRFPADLEDGPGTYDDFVIQGSSMPKEIEVYTGFDFTAEPERIPLTALEEREMTFYGLSANTDNTYTALSYQQVGKNSYQPYLHIFDSNGNLIDESPIKIDLLKFDVYYPYGDALYYIEQYRLKKNAPMSDGVTTVDEDAIAFTRQGTELYYVRSVVDENHDAQRSLWVYDLITGEKREIAEINSGRKMNSIAYDAVNEVLYFSDYSYIYAHPLSVGGDIKVAAALDTTITLLDASNGCLSAKIGHNQIAMYTLPESPASMNRDKITLRICVADMEKGKFAENNRELLMAMEVNGISVTIEETYIGTTLNSDEYMSTMAKKLLAGDSDFDLFCVNTRMSSLFKEGYYEDLTKYPVLNAYYDLMLPGVTSLCTVGETLSFVPASLSTTMALADTTLTGGKAHPIPELLDDMLPYMNSLSDTLQDNDGYFIRSGLVRSVMDMWFDQYLANFMAKTVDDDTAYADLEKLYTAVQDMLNHPSVSVDRSATSYGGRVSQSYFSQIDNFGYNSARKDSEIIAATPKINAAYGEPFYGSFYAINPNSENKELAALFLAFFMENSREDSRIYTGTTQHTEETRTDVSDLFRNQLENGIRAYELSGWLMYLNEKVDGILNGTLTPADAAEETFRYLKMTRDE